MKSILTTSIIIAVSVILGLIFDSFLLRKFVRFLEKRNIEKLRIIFSSFKGWLLLWIILIGIYIILMKLSPPEFIKLANRVIIGFMILSISIITARVLAGFLSIYGIKYKWFTPTATLLPNLLRITILIIGFLILLNYFGIPITPILTTLGIGGLAVALALQDVLSNLFAGLSLIVLRQIKVGDYIKLSTGEEGYIEDITWRNTIVRELPNNRIIIPNTKIANTIIKNYYLPNKETALLVDVGVSYDSDLERVEKITIEVAKETLKEVKGGVPEFEPLVRYHTFGEYSINFTVILRVKEVVDQYLIKHEFIKRLHKRYREENIEIPFPVRTVILRNNTER